MYLQILLALHLQSMLIHMEHLHPHMLAFVIVPKVNILLNFQQPYPCEENHVLD
jgi:hypothetical protein